MLVRNTIKHMTYTRFGRQEVVSVSDEELETLQNECQEFLKALNVNIGKNRVRELIVEYILEEFGTDAFGVSPIYRQKKISDKAVKKYQKARRRGF